ncbi:MAG: class I SAM-dependent methyltransferase [Marinilabiliaceae bacterium]
MDTDKVVTTILEPHFWENAWQASVKSSSRNQSGSDPEKQILRWNRMAKWFSQRTASPEAEQRKNKIITLLEKEGALSPESRVLDIGAGPGNWTIPLARIAALVTALEPAGEMVRRLNERVAAEGLTNVQVDQRRWEEVDPEAENLTGQFDLVFASMTPGVSNPASLSKVIAASRGFCYLSRFSGQGWRKTHAELWREMFGEDPGPNPGDIIYPFNLLYAMGFRPRLHFEYWTHDREETVEDAIENLRLFFEDHAPLTPEIEDKIKNYVETRATDGIFRQTQDVCQGIMLWDVRNQRGVA